MRDLERGDVFPESWTDGIQEYISTVATNLRIERPTTTTLQVPAGTGDDQVTLGIDGLWRYRTSAVSAGGPGGAAAVHDIYAVASANIFADTPDPDTDTTDYTFGIQVLASGGTPSGTHGGRAITGYRKIGEAEWDGAKYTAVRVMTGNTGRDATPIWATAPAADMSAGTFRGIVGQTAPVLLVESSTGTDLLAVAPDGDVTIGDALIVTGPLDHNGTTVGLFGVAPAARAAATADIKDALTTYGLLQGTSASPLNLDGGALTAGALTATGNVRLGDADTDTVGFFSVVGAARAAATTDLKDALTSYGLLQGTSASPLDLDGGLLTPGRVNVPAVAGQQAYRSSQANLETVLANFLLTSDANPNFRIRSLTAGGELAWGPGGATAVDTTLARDAVGVLAVTGLRTINNIEIDGSLDHDGANIGFFGIAPVARATATADIKDALTAYGLLQGTSATPLNLDGGTLTAATVNATSGLQVNGVALASTHLTDSADLVRVGQGITQSSLTVTGNTRLGDADTDTVGFFSVAGVARASATADIKDALVAYGLLQGSSATPLNLDGGTLTAASGIFTAGVTVDPGAGTATAGLSLVGRNAGVANSTSLTASATGGLTIVPKAGQALALGASGDTLSFFGVTAVARQSATADIKDALVAYGLLQGTSATPLNLDGGALTVGAATVTGNFDHNGTVFAVFNQGGGGRSTGWGTFTKSDGALASSRKTLAAGYTMDQLLEVVATMQDALASWGFMD